MTVVFIFYVVDVELFFKFVVLFMNKKPNGKFWIYKCAEFTFDLHYDFEKNVSIEIVN